MPFDVFDVVELGCKGVQDIDDDDFPVGLALIEKGHDAEDLDLLDLANIADLFADLADIERIIVAFGLGLCMELRRIFPSLGESTIVPNVSVVGEAVPDVAQFASLDVLLDGVEGLLFRDLHFGVSPAGDFDDHVEDAMVLVGEEGDVVEGGDDGTILLDVDAMLEGVGSADETRGVLGHGGGGRGGR